MNVNIVTPIKATTPATAEIERLGLSYHEEQNYDLERLSEDRRVQVRDSDHYAPPDRVEEYANQMAQTIFPPIVATLDDYLVDGATREKAYAIRKQRFAPAIIIETAFAAPTTTPKQKNTLYALRVTLNQQNGERLTSKEKLLRVPSFLALGWKMDQISRATGLSEGQIKRLRKELEVRTRMERVGLPNEGIASAKILPFAHKSVDGLNNEPFKQLAVLSKDAGLKAGEVITLAKEAAATGSDDGALKHLAEQRAEMRDRIQALTLTGQATPQESKMFRNMHLAYIVKFVGREQELLETDPNVAPAHIDMLTKAIDVLVALRRMQQ